MMSFYVTVPAKACLTLRLVSSKPRISQQFNILGLMILVFCFKFATSQIRQSGETGGLSCSEFEVCMDIGKCHTHFKKSADVAAHSCGRGKVFCRNMSKRNRLRKIPEENRYFPFFSKSL